MIYIYYVFNFHLVIGGSKNMIGMITCWLKKKKNITGLNGQVRDIQMVELGIGYESAVDVRKLNLH